jgi:hypothetical protein
MTLGIPDAPNAAVELFPLWRGVAVPTPTRNNTKGHVT